MKRILCVVLLLSLLASCRNPKPAAAPATQPAADASVFRTGFEGGSVEYMQWQLQGQVSSSPGADAYAGNRCLRFDRPVEKVLEPMSATGPSFQISQGSYDVQVAMRTDLQSPDNSYNATVHLQLTDTAGKTGDGLLVAEQDGHRGWRVIRKQVDIPASYTSARFKVQINKAAGTAWVDELSIRRSATAAGDTVVNRLFFQTKALGNLFYPQDPRTMKAVAWTLRPLSDNERQASFVVRDYFGAEQADPIAATLHPAGRERAFHVYTADIDLAAAKLEIGRYYEVHGTIRKDGGGVYSNHTSLAILPEAPANAFKPDEIPFTGRTWDARVPVAIHLMHRLGIRVAGVWGTWSPTPPYPASAPCMDEVQKLGMGFITNTPAMSVETRAKGWERYTDETMRAGVRNFYEKYKHLKPFIVNLGNEPHNKGDEIKPNITAYKAIYEEFKRLDPNIIVVSTSVGPSDEFFKYGLGQYCDAYDFHVYGDSSQIRDMIEKQYPALFAKYGHKRPIWSTELGLDSHGMARLPVAIELVKKLSNFFAAGGTNCSWFNMMYPDPDGTLSGSSAEAHNVFDCRYNQYAPKLEAIANYNMVNGIANKKFVAEKVYTNGVKAFLFRNDAGECLQVLYTDKGIADIGVPLAGVKAVKVIRIDGSISNIVVEQDAVTLTAGVEPLLLLYTSEQAKLPEQLRAPHLIIHSPYAITAGESAVLKWDTTNTKWSGRVDLHLPFGWKQGGSFGGEGTKIVAPAETAARQADLKVLLRNRNDDLVGELYRRPAVTGRVVMSMVPVPAADQQPPGVKLVIDNNSTTTQAVRWSVELLGAKPVVDGAYPEKLQLAEAHFTGPAEGSATLASGQTREVFIPLAKINSHTAYFLRAVATDSTGRQVVDERPVAGFAGVSKAAGKITFDGVLDEPAWKAAPVLTSDQLNQYYNFKRRSTRDKEWTGPDDLSCRIRYLWDETHLYVAVEVADDVFGGATKADGDIWAQDGLQFLVDPARTSARKPGKYDYGLGIGKKGPQAWCFLSADNVAAPPGEVRDLKLAIKSGEKGNKTYELAFPWSRLSPFKPSAGANLGFTMIVNEDDGHGRDSFLTWFGNAHTKDIDTVGDLILLDASKP